MGNSKFITLEFLHRQVGGEGDITLKKTVNAGNIMDITPHRNMRDPRKTVDIRFREAVSFEFLIRYPENLIVAEAIGTFEDISKLLTDPDNLSPERTWNITTPGELIQPPEDHSYDRMISIPIYEDKFEFHIEALWVSWIGRIVESGSGDDKITTLYCKGDMKLITHKSAYELADMINAALNKGK